jgi:RimJ/RimL family protein N-acetyltransferase
MTQLVEPSARSSMLTVSGFALFVDYLFAGWNFRKLYLEIPEYNYPPMKSFASRFFAEEGRLAEHAFMAGRWWDLIIVALWRKHWEATSMELPR